MSDKGKEGEGNTNELIELRAENERLRARAQNFEGKLTDFEKRFSGIDPDKVRRLEAELDDFKNKDAGGDKGKIEERINAAKEKIRAELGAQLEAAQGEANTLRGQVKELSVVGKVFGDAAGKFVSKFHPFLKDQIRQFCDADKEGNIIVKDSKGEIRYKGSKPMSHADFIEELASENDYAVVSSDVSGSKGGGTKAGTGNGSVSSLNQLSGLSSSEQMDRMRKMDPKDLGAALNKFVSGQS